MERLLADAQELSGVEYDIENLSDVYNAIHVIQTELGITGTTAKEADATISGSFASMKAALDNFITGFGDENADMDTLFSNLIDSADTFLNGNLIPTVERILKTVIDKIPEMLPKVLEAIGGLIETIGGELPSLLSGLWELLDTEVFQNFPEILSGITDLIGGFIDSLPDILGEILPKITQLINDIVDNLPNMLTRIASAISNNLPAILKQLFDSLISILRNLFQNAGEIMRAANTLMHSLFEALSEALPGLIEELIALIPDLLSGLIDMIVEQFTDLPSKIWDRIKLILSFFEGLWDGIKRIFKPVVDWFKDIFGGAADGVKAAWEGIKAFFSGIWDGITSVFSGVASFFENTFGAAVDGIEWVFDKLFGWIKSAADGVESLLESIGLLDQDTEVVVGKASPIYPTTQRYSGSVNSASDARRLMGHAKGGIVTREHIARVGEDGAEAIIPLEHNTEWIDRVAERLNGSGSGDVIAKLDELNSSIKSLKIYLDGEALVGGIAPAMDKKLGSISRLKRRSAI